MATLLTLAACGGGDGGGRSPGAAGRPCAAGTPEAIFAATDPGVLDHRFELRGQRGDEEASFGDGSRLELRQSGCDTLEQAFTLHFAEGTAAVAWDSARTLIAGQFNAYARLDAHLLTFGQYANAVAAVPREFPMPEPANLAPGLSLRAYPVPGDGGRSWLVEFRQVLGAPNGAQ